MLPKQQRIFEGEKAQKSKDQWDAFDKEQKSKSQRKDALAKEKAKLEREKKGLEEAKKGLQA